MQSGENPVLVNGSFILGRAVGRGAAQLGSRRVVGTAAGALAGRVYSVRYSLAGMERKKSARGVDTMRCVLSEILSSRGWVSASSAAFTV